MDCQALGAWPESFSLAGANSVSIGRGLERRLLPGGAHLRLDLPDRWISQNHARLVRAGERWSIEDDGSRNGSRVNGERVERKTLNDGDIIECGGTYLVLRRTDGFTPSVGALPERPEALRTLSPALDHELNVLRKVARSAIPVLVLGESGTGKEGIARAIHALSGREGPFVALNCGAIPATLVESELFGTRRGAFTGAEDRLGLLRQAERCARSSPTTGRTTSASSSSSCRPRSRSRRARSASSTCGRRSATRASARASRASSTSPISSSRRFAGTAAT